MKLLLDTHIIYWSVSEPEKLSDHVRTLMEDKLHTIYISEVSIMELAIKMSIGKLTYKGGLQELLDDISKTGIQFVSLERNHYFEYVKLPLHHRDPFDRFIISQAISQGLTIVTNDASFKLYNTEIIWNN